jgi:UDP-glucose 4-epimerase
MKALITGGAGFIGSHLSDVLLSRDCQVVVLDDLSTGSMDNIGHLIDNPDFSCVIDTVLNEMVLDRLVSDCDVVYHLAAAVGVQLIVQQPVHTIRTNVEGTNCVLKAVRRYCKKVIIASTSEVYGKSSKVPFAEGDDTVSGPTTKHRWAYACSKAIDEFAAFAMAKESDVPVYVVRLFNTVGVRQSGQYGMVIPNLVGQALSNEPITVFGDGDQTRCFANVADITRAMADLLDHPEAEGEVINLGSDKEVTINELARTIRDVLGSQSDIVHISYAEAYEDGFEDMMRRVPDLQKAGRLLGYAPTIDLEQTILEVGGRA